MTFTKEQLQAKALAVPFWFHSIDLGQGVITNGWKSPEQLAIEVEHFRLPDLKGKTVLDINAWDGFYSFEAERRGAVRVVALDQYMWAMDLGEHNRYWKECQERGVAPAPYHTRPYYQPDKLPGKIGFDTAHAALGSKVEVVVGDFMEMELRPLGTFDVVFYFGSLYHMENPLEAMRRVVAVTNEVAIIETEAASFSIFDQHALCEFFESDQLNGDVSNWWAPNDKALAGLCRAAGFSRVDAVASAPPHAGTAVPTKSLPRKLRRAAGRALRALSPTRALEGAGEVTRYRAVVHAWK